MPDRVSVARKGGDNHDRDFAEVGARHRRGCDPARGPWVAPAGARTRRRGHRQQATATSQVHQVAMQSVGAAARAGIAERR